MAEEEAAEKKHAPSEKGWRDAAEKGQIPKSQDISAGAVLLAGAMALVFGSGPLGRAITSLARHMFQADPELDLSSAVALGQEMMLTIVISISIPLGFIAVLATAANLAQTQFKMGTKALEPKPERLDLFKGFKEKYLSWTPLVELGKGVGKLLALSLVMAWALWGEVEILPSLAMLTPAEFMDVLKEIAWIMVVASLPLIAALSAADYGYNYYRQHQQLKRTDKQVRDDSKEQEGDPHMRAARKARARQIAFGQTLMRVQEADVLVTNPTHYAVALRYRRGEDDAPVVLAKGMDHLALKMRQEARRHDVPRVEDRPLARGLYRHARVGRAIPEAYFPPVARVLAVVFRRRAQRLARRRARV